jgi:hypothetical protein
VLRIQADLEEAYILSAFRRKDENDMADSWKGVFLDLSHNGHNGHNGEAKEAPEAADTAGTGLPSVESLRATLQALRVQDRLRMEAPLVPTVPTVPMAAMAAVPTAAPMSTAPATRPIPWNGQNLRGYHWILWIYGYGYNYWIVVPYSQWL